MIHRLNGLWFRLFLSYAIPLVLFLAAATVAYITIQRLLTAQKHEMRAEGVLRKAHDLKANVLGMAAAKRAHHLLGEDAFKVRFEELYQVTGEDLETLRNHAQNDENRLEILDEIGSLKKQWYGLAQNDFERFDLFWRRIQGEPVKKSDKPALKEATAVNEAMLRYSDKLIGLEAAELTDRRDRVTKITEESLLVIVGTTLLAIVSSLLVSFQVTQSVTRPINRLRDATSDLRQGHFTVVPLVGPSEIMELIRSFNVMGTALAEHITVLDRREHRYRQIVGTTSTLLWSTNARGENLDMSTWCAFTGQEKETVKGEGWLEAVHPEDRERFSHRCSEAAASKTYMEVEIRIRRADGCYRDFTCRHVPIVDSEGKFLEWVRICTDITERKQDERLRKEKDAAEAANRAKSDFLAKMSHELRTPLNAVIGMSKMLQTQRFGSLTPKQTEYLTDITQSGEYLLGLINDILDLSKVEAGRMDLTLESVPISSTITAILSTVQTLAESKTLSIASQPPHPDGAIITDRSRVKQILFNLVSNAVKFTSSGGRVNVRCYWVEGVSPDTPPTDAAKATAVRFDVEDTGIGIEEKDQELIGSEFFQGKRNRSQATEGTGLGLALTRRLVHLLGGSFWFKSIPGQGSVFSFTLPMSLPSAVSLEREPFCAETPDTHRLPLAKASSTDGAAACPRALVIEDYAPTNRLLCDWLRDAGLEVHSAFDGMTGLEQARTLLPQLIVLDLRLPDLRGWRVLTELKSRSETASIPVVVVSVMDGHELPREMDILEWFVKPVDKELFLQRLRSVCPALLELERTPIALVVDDDPMVREWLRRMLTSAGFKTVEAAGGQEALNCLNNLLPDLVLLDLLMPETDGCAVVEAIRSNPQWKDLPILIITAKDMNIDEEHLLEGKIQAILEKSTLTQEKLLSRVRELGFSCNFHDQ